MAESGVILPADSTGKALRSQTVTTTFTSGVGGVAHQQVVSLGDPTTAANLAGVVAKGTQGGFALTTQNLKDSGRTPVAILVDNIAGITTEALVSYGGNNGATALTAGTGAFVVPTGKTFHIQAMHVSATGSAAGTVRVRVRYAATIAATSPLVGAAAFVVVPAASSGNSSENAYPDGIEIAAGNAIGITCLASATTVTYTVVLTGYTY